MSNTEENKEETNTFVTANQNSIMNTPFMIMRLDTAPLLNDIKNFLASKEVDMKQDANGEWQEEIKQIGVPLANDEGIMRICNIVRMRINKDVVQGNLKEDHYWENIARARKEITETVVKKCYDWEIDDSNLNMVIDEVNALIEMYLTRTIGNKEREGYSNTVQAKENTIIQQPRSSWGSFGGSGVGQQ